MARLVRRSIPSSTELLVLDNSRRRCPLCYKLKGDLTEKRGQIAHLDQNPANYAEGNLAWLCLEHHSEYDSRTSQHKNYTMAEVKNARDDLYAAIQALQHLAAPAVRTEGRNADRNTLKDIIHTISGTIGRLRNWSFNGTSFPVAWFAPFTEFLNERRGPEFEFVDTELETVPIRLTPTPTTSRFWGAVLSASRPRWADILWAQSEQCCGTLMLWTTPTHLVFSNVKILLKGVHHCVSAKYL